MTADCILPGMPPLKPFPAGMTPPEQRPPLPNGLPPRTETGVNMSQTSSIHSFPLKRLPPDQRPRLPPLAQTLLLSGRHEGTGSISPVSTAGSHRHMLPPTSPQTIRAAQSGSARSSPSYHHDHIQEPYPLGSIQLQTANWNIAEDPTPEHQSSPLKRSHSIMVHPTERYFQQPHNMMSPAYTDPGHSPFRPTHAQLPYSTRTSISDPLTPSRTHSLISMTGSLQAPPMSQHTSVTSSATDARRYSLFVRQQPRAARAGPDGKDRRAIDPPPVLQLMLDDFDPSSESDMAEIRSSYFVVHCRLLSAHTPEKDVSTLSCLNDDGSTEVQRLLLGTTVSSPFFCQDDPDPENMPEHPRTNSKTALADAPPSPTSRFIRPRYSMPSTTPTQPRNVPLPGSFFIFPDLSIRKAGSYRLLFSLMKISPEQLLFGSRLPIIYSVTSNIFKVVNAKDFDQVQASTELVKGLLDRGAGFPLKLKKGTREGQVSRRGRESRGDSEDDDGDGEGNADDDDGEETS